MCSTQAFRFGTKENVKMLKNYLKLTETLLKFDIFRRNVIQNRI